ncbi:PPE domain-containing protein [Actinophytocola sp.]|uniref:PPE domain-containing protein n=1 Tax=Actinophytocola sp. TaxID=1872138 RepID=UPI002D376AAC|nr:hypothetical protein [Actinophytocola sp.]HYQ61633.1 hypothetical protein [Actinophytocola sp.]
MGNTGDLYVDGGVNWGAFTLEQLVGMVSDKASVPQLERLADDWRETGEGVIAAADYLADALDDLMNFWSGESAEQARQTVALNAQWVGDLGATARGMGSPIEEAAGALKSAQEAMPKLPTPEQAVPGSAPQGADAASNVTGGSHLGAAVGATAAGSDSAFQAQAEQEDMKRVAIETMQRFEAAALGIDQATPQFQSQSDVLRPRVDVDVVTGGDGVWLDRVKKTTGVDARFQALTGLTDASAAKAPRFGAADFGFAGAGGEAADVGTVGAPAGGGAIGGNPERGGGVSGARPGLAAAATFGAAPGTAPGAGSGTSGPIGGAPMGGAGMGTQADGQQHRRRVPFDGEDPFDTGQQASKPVIGI